MSDAKIEFYDDYHKKNDDFFKVIKENNFTYFYLQKALHSIFTKFKPQNVLDVGCGVGTIGFYLASKGIAVDGFDVSSRAISIANHYKKIGRISNIRFYNDDVQKQKFKNKYDLVVCTEVIEHLEKDTEMLKVINRATNRGGYLLLSTPSINAPLYKLGLLKKFDKEVGHIRRYRLEKLIVLVNDAGFSIEKTYKVEGILRNSLFTLPLIGNLIRFIKGPLIPFFHLVDEFSATLFGESDLIVIAKKL